MKDNQNPEVKMRHYAKGILDAFKQSTHFESSDKDTPQIVGKQILDHMTGKKPLSQQEQEQLKQEINERRSLNNL